MDRGRGRGRGSRGGGHRGQGDWQQGRGRGQGNGQQGRGRGQGDGQQGGGRGRGGWQQGGASGGRGRGGGHRDSAVGGNDEDLVCEVTKGLSEITVHSIPPAPKLGTVPLRPGLGTKGRTIDLIANHFGISLPEGKIYHYDLSIKDVKSGKGNEGEKKLSKRMCREVFQVLSDKHRKDFFEGMLPAFDGQKNVILRNKLEQNGKTKRITLSLDGGDAEFDVTLKYANTIDLQALNKIFTWVQCQKTPQQQQRMLTWKEEKKDDIANAIMGLNIILRHAPSFTLIPVGYSFFPIPEPGEYHPMSGARQVWHGYRQSLRPGWKPFVVIDRSLTTFYKADQNLVDFVREILNIRGDVNKLVGRNLEKVEKELRNVKVEVTHLSYKRRHTIKRLVGSARETTFPLEENGKKKDITVENYFLKQYNLRLNYPNLPCIEYSQGKYLPMEVCKILANQPCNRKLNSSQTAEIIKISATKPEERFKEIQKYAKVAAETSSIVMKEFSISLSTDPVHLQGRVLDPPQIQYKASSLTAPEDGVWDMRKKQFEKSAKIENWALLSFADPEKCTVDHLGKFSTLLIDTGRNAGLNLGSFVETLTETYSRPGDAEKVLTKLQKRGITLVVIVIPDDKALYSEIKLVGDTMLGLVTQCVQDNNVVRKCNVQYASNVCLKINAKCGGINGYPVDKHFPVITEDPIIFMGADVTHPAADDNKSPSIAAVVGSLDGYPCKHAVEIRVQKAGNEIKGRLEIISDLEDMVKSLLKAFYRNTKQKPRKIIFYRDGVSEGQFEQVMNHELLAIRRACTKLEEAYKPPITFIVVQKRHHTRFYPQNPRKDGNKRNGNVPAGTVVDKVITHPTDFDFFLCSHQGLQGTSRPTHYVVLWDDNNYDADTLQTMTYSLCHAYVRCTRSISIPAQVMYAHLAAFRARYYLNSGTLRNVDISEVVKAAAEFKDKMYFI